MITPHQAGQQPDKGIPISYPCSVKPWKVRAGPAELASGSLLKHRQQDTRPEDPSSQSSQKPEQIRCSQERLPQSTIPNVCSTWEPLQALASCTSLHWSMAAGNLGKSQQLLGLTMIPAQHSSAVLAFTCCSWSLGSAREETQGRCSGFSSLVSCQGVGVAAAQGCELPSGPLRFWWRSCSSQPYVLAVHRQRPSLWSCFPPWQVFHQKEHRCLRVTHEAQGPPGLRLMCRVKPAKVALQWSCHSGTAEADLAASAHAACNPGQPPQPLHPSSATDSCKFRAFLEKARKPPLLLYPSWGGY